MQEIKPLLTLITNLTSGEFGGIMKRILCLIFLFCILQLSANAQNAAYRVYTRLVLPITCSATSSSTDVVILSGTNDLYICKGSNLWQLIGGGSSISGSGVANRVAFWNGTSFLSSDSGFTFDGTNDDLTIGRQYIGQFGTFTPLSDLPTFTLRRFSAGQTNFVFQIQDESNNFLAGFNALGGLRVNSVIAPNSAGLAALGTSSLPFSALFLGTGVSSKATITGTFTGSRIFTIVDSNSNSAIPSVAGSNQFVNGFDSGGNFIYAQPAFSNLSGNIAVSQMNSGTNADSTHFWRGDATWATIDLTTKANTALDNLAAVNINSALLAQTGIDLGSTTKPFRDLFLFGSGTYGTNYFRVTGTPTGARVVTLPDLASYTLAQITNSQTFGGTQTFGSIIGTSLSLGTNPATTGPLNLANNAKIYFRNAANSADIQALSVDTSNQVQVGSTSSSLVLSFWNVNVGTGRFETSAGQFPIGWAGTSAYVSSATSGIVEINNGTNGTYRDLRLRSIGVNNAPTGTGVVTSDITNATTYQAGGITIFSSGTPSIAGNATLNTGSKDSSGKITSTGTGASTAVITFSITFTRAPACFVTNETTSNLVRPISTTTTLTINATVVNGDSLSYTCLGY